MENPTLLLMPSEQRIRRYALATMYHAMNGDAWTLKSNWMVSEDECSWHGLTCVQGSPVSLELTNNNVRGEFPYEVNMLSTLTSLILKNPPESIAQSIRGPFPDVWALQGLETLDLSGNRLSGTIPDELFSTTSALRELDLEGNRLGGALPPSLLNVASSLTVLNLAGNQLTSIPVASIEQLGQLTVMNLRGNGFGGQIPDLSNLLQLQELNLSGNNLASQPLPGSIGLLTNMARLDMSSNALTGVIPPSLGGLTSLTALFLNDNQLVGPCPAELADLTSISVIRLDKNNLTGAVPSTVCDVYSANKALAYIDCDEVSGASDGCFSYCCTDSSAECTCSFENPFDCFRSG